MNGSCSRRIRTRRHVNEAGNIAGFSVSAAQSQPLTEASSWYVLVGKHTEPSSLCYANIVAEKFRDGTYVEAEAAESARRD
jgi:hypothetical protein